MISTKERDLASKDNELATKDERIATKATKDDQIDQIQVTMETRLQVWYRW